MYDIIDQIDFGSLSKQSAQCTENSFGSFTFNLRLVTVCSLKVILSGINLTQAIPSGQNRQKNSLKD